VNEGMWSTPGKKRPHANSVSALDNFDNDAIRNKINEFYVVRKEVPTLRTLLEELRSSINFSGCRETLRKILIANGYEFKKNKNERMVLVERYDIAAWRHRYLREIAAKRAEGKPIIYLDETYVHKNYKPKMSWQGPSTSGNLQPSPLENISSGKRYIIVHAGSEKGFVPNALLVFSTKSRFADYHHDMNAENFEKWLQEKLIPNLNQPSVIVMDNASYHTVQNNKVPTTQIRKAEIQEWLDSRGINYNNYFTKAELLCLVNKNKPEPLYVADEILKQYGHEILRLPPYHCDLNPIELIWSSAKRMVAKKNINLSAMETEALIKSSFGRITAEDWKTMVDHVIKVENKYKKRDHITEEVLEKFIISVGDNDSTDSEESLEVEFLDSDFDYGDG
jgi:transposase